MYVCMMFFENVCFTSVHKPARWVLLLLLLLLLLQLLLPLSTTTTTTTTTTATTTTNNNNHNDHNHTYNDNDSNSMRRSIIVVVDISSVIVGITMLLIRNMNIAYSIASSIINTIISIGIINIIKY